MPDQDLLNLIDAECGEALHNARSKPFLRRYYHLLRGLPDSVLERIAGGDNEYLLGLAGKVLPSEYPADYNLGGMPGATVFGLVCANLAVGIGCEYWRRQGVISYHLDPTPFVTVASCWVYLRNAGRTLLTGTGGDAFRAFMQRFGGTPNGEAVITPTHDSQPPPFMVRSPGAPRGTVD